MRCACACDVYVKVLARTVPEEAGADAHAYGVTGAMTGMGSLSKPPQRASRIEILRMPRRRNQKCWPTCIAISPYDGNVYVCQYKAGACV